MPLNRSSPITPFRTRFLELSKKTGEAMWVNNLPKVCYPVE